LLKRQSPQVKLTMPARASSSGSLRPANYTSSAAISGPRRRRRSSRSLAWSLRHS